MKSSARIVSLMLTIFLFIGIFATTANAASTDLKTGIGFVSASSLRLRSGPSSSSATIAYAGKSEVVVVLGRSGSWYKVVYNLKTGYMHKDYLNVSATENAELGYGNIVASSVNVRSGPGTGYASLTKATKGTKAYIIGLNNQWFKVIYGSHVGYIRSDYVELAEIPYENKASNKTPLFFRGGKSTGVTPSASALNGMTSLRERLVSTAKQYIGVPYVWGGSTPSGFDCSGFVKYVFDRNGISLPRTSSEQWKVGTWIPKSSLKAGDLVFFDTGSGGVSHLGIFIGNGQFIHASSSKGVVISSLSSTYWTNAYYGSRRVI